MALQVPTQVRYSLLVLFLLLAQPLPADSPAPWLSTVRESPYWISAGVYQNVVTIRRWVLHGRSYCEDPQRHILYDRRGRFIGYISNGQSRAETQMRLNQTRKSYLEQGRVESYIPGGPLATGYPFALSCEQPHVDMDGAIRRYLGEDEEGQIWGTWDDLSIGSADAPVSLHQALRSIYATRLAQQRIELPEELPLYLAGKLLIESGGQARAHSAANARGIMQLSPAVLNDCGIAERNHWHRMAQFDCALRLLNQNARNLQAPFMARFGELPEAKRERLFTLLLIQAYHGGAGRVKALLEDEELSRPAAYFARHQSLFSAGDIAYGMIYHNLGRNRLGQASLYYIADVEVAVSALCGLPDFAAESGCEGFAAAR